jgi:hypothetical protein
VFDPAKSAPSGGNEPASKKEKKDLKKVKKDKDAKAEK